MASLNGFDATQVAPQEEFKPIPEGEYLARITASENKPTKAGTGSYLQLTFEIMDGQYKGRQLWARLNLSNPNSQAVEIAKRELSAICHAVNVLTPGDSADLHNLPMTIRVGCVNRSDNGELTNEIKGYKKRADLQAAPESAQPASGEAPPAWMGN